MSYVEERMEQSAPRVEDIRYEWRVMHRIQSDDVPWMLEYIDWLVMTLNARYVGAEVRLAEMVTRAVEKTPPTPPEFLRAFASRVIDACARAEGHHNGAPWDWSIDVDGIIEQSIAPKKNAPVSSRGAPSA